MAGCSDGFVSLSKTSSKVLLSLISVIILLPTCRGRYQVSRKDPEITFATLYDEGKDAYYEERWGQCVSYILKSLEDYKFYRRNLAHCRLSCKTVAASQVNKKRRSLSNNMDMLFLYGAVQNSDCQRRCWKKLFGRRREVTDKDVLRAFETNEPYNYLQLCFFKTGNFKQAASSAYTFFLANPDHQVMLKNIHQYRQMDGMKDSDFVFLEMPAHIDLYLKGVAAHEKSNYIESIEVIEKALQSFYLANEECCVLCEGPLDHQGLPDFYSAIADHYINVLTCKQKCYTRHSSLYGSFNPKLLADHYHYLQYAYFQGGDLVVAAQCVATYLMLNPNDPNMIINKRLYMALGLSEEQFIPRADATRFHSRTSNEAELMNLVNNGRYMFSSTDDDDEEDMLSNIDIKPMADGDRLHSLGKEFIGDGNGNGARYKNGNGFEGFTQYLTEEMGVTITDRLDENGRIMGEGLLKKAECSELVSAANIGGLPKEGERELVRNSLYPEAFPREVIQFLRVDRLAEVMKIGKVKKKALQLYLNTAHTMREIAENYYNLTEQGKSLHFLDLRVLCRRIHNSKPDDIERLEEVCVLQEDGLCLKDESWKYVDYHGVLYLNSQHLGGTVDYFIPGGGVKNVVSPGCGKFVITSPRKNVHNVHPITKGSRCVMSMAMSADDNLGRDAAPMKAEQMLREYEYLESTPKDTHYSDGMMEFYENRGILVSLKPADLHGDERFAADGLADDEQCNMLIKLATSHGAADNGYHEGNLGTVQHSGRKQSPHTKHEIFQGLTVDKAAKLAQNHLVDADAVRMYMNLSELAKEMTQNYFKLDTQLYFDYTHLVCRTAVNEENKNRTDLSHPVHSDNCLLQPDGSCRKELPAYIQRDYSALLYLNGNFEGGEFIFTDNALNVVSEVKPKCGRMVSFNAGDLHGVKAVLKGQRCAIAMWYTLDPHYKETAHRYAKNILSGIKNTDGKPKGPMGPSHEHGEL